MLQSIRDILVTSTSGVDFHVTFTGEIEGTPIRLFSVDQIGISFIHLPVSKREMTFVPWHRIDNLRIDLADRKNVERPDGVAPSSHAGEPRSSDGRAA